MRESVAPVKSVDMSGRAPNGGANQKGVSIRPGSSADIALWNEDAVGPIRVSDGTRAPGQRFDFATAGAE